MSDAEFKYDNARVDRVVDGDTLWLTIDLGFNLQISVEVRLIDVDTHEIHGVSHKSAEYQRGARERDWVVDWLTEAEMGQGEWPLRVITYGTGKFGRCLAYIQRKSDGAILNEDLLDTFGDSVRYRG